MSSKNEKLKAAQLRGIASAKAKKANKQSKLTFFKYTYRYSNLFRDFYHP
jgi:hypothetical protein